MPQKIYLIRHGETAYNAVRRTQGWIDIPLNDTGHIQAKQSANKLIGISIDYIYSSDLRRAHETAQHVSRVAKKDIFTTSQLRERNMGIFAGSQWDQEEDLALSKLRKEFVELGEGADPHWNKHKGESFYQMSSRIGQFMDNLHVVHNNKNVAVVTHAGTINRILEHYQLKSITEGFRTIGNASILVMTKTETSYTLSEI